MAHTPSGYSSLSFSTFPTTVHTQLPTPAFTICSLVATAPEPGPVKPTLPNTKACLSLLTNASALVSIISSAVATCFATFLRSNGSNLAVSSSFEIAREMLIPSAVSGLLMLFDAREVGEKVVELEGKAEEIDSVRRVDVRVR